MKSQFYLPRTLIDDAGEYSEVELLASHKHVVVLAEPGGGKSDVLNSLAGQLGVTAVTANVFAQMGPSEPGVPLVIDAFDELAKIDATGIHRLLGYARRSRPSHLILSSRSSEWDNAVTAAFKDFFGVPPRVLRFREFNVAEQRKIFEWHAKGEDFLAFQGEVSRFDLDALLPNPQFLKLFADAYIESGRKFSDKRSIFQQAVERLAKEANTQLTQGRPALSITKKIQLASETFAKVLLAGAEGVGTREVMESRIYPVLSSIVPAEVAVEGILATRLFKPGDTPDHHRPVHKIVTEYCAADYLTKRIADPADPLTLARCLPIIAPNSTVRDELRGMLAWMASLGSKAVQECAIELDPYAVLANGDPSQLEPSSKNLLISQLKRIEERDPHFRRADFWRRFSVAGFFTQEVVDQIAGILVGHDGWQLRHLMLELLEGSPAIAALADELQQLVLSPHEAEGARVLASRCLARIHDYDAYPALGGLVFEATQVSLKVAAEMIEAVGVDRFDASYLASFFRVCTHLYPHPHSSEGRERTIGARFFIKRLIGRLDLSTVDSLLDQLSEQISCRCEKKHWRCECRVGISKIMGSLLDRYFKLAPPPHDAGKIWRWCQNLYFADTSSMEQSEAVHVLQTDHALRQRIISDAFSHLTDPDEIFELRARKFDFHSHTGLRFRSEDYWFIIQRAFEIDNPRLWSCFLVQHRRYLQKNDRGPDPLRRLMRLQALQKPLFMKEWSKCNRDASAIMRKTHVSNAGYLRRMKRRNRREDQARTANKQFVRDNRGLIESGRHWPCLCRFAWLVLTKSNEIENEFGDGAIASIALRNCLDFINESVPDLQRLAELQCKSQGTRSETVLYAACLEILRQEGNLARVDRRLLQALRTGIEIHYDAVSEDERQALKAEVNRLLFHDIESTESFLREYLEPQLAAFRCHHTQIWWLRDEELFAPMRGQLSVEWLARYRGVDFSTLDTLFEIALQFGELKKLEEVIRVRCAEFMSFWPDETGNDDIEHKRIFWLIRSWLFLDQAPAVYWSWLKSRKNTLLVLNNLFGRFNGSDRQHWPRMTSVQVEAVLDAFIEQWPRVDLPDSFGTESPDTEKAYRFLTEIVWAISRDDPDQAIPVLDRLLSDVRFAGLQDDLKSIRAGQVRNKALRDFQPPSPYDIVELLDKGAVVSVEGLRGLVVEELRELQRAIYGGEFNSGDRFYQKGERLDEVSCTSIIAERLSLRLQPQNIIIIPEHQLKNAKRSDFTASKVIGGVRRLLVTEVKGQWHPELYTAASAQLSERYSIHPDAEQQGVFLTIWFGPSEKVAGSSKHGIKTAKELEAKIVDEMPQQLHGLVDVFVLDVSRG